MSTELMMDAAADDDSDDAAGISVNSVDFYADISTQTCGSKQP